MGGRAAPWMFCLLLAACAETGGGSGPPATGKSAASTAASRMIDGRYYVSTGAPDPLACEKNEDCAGDTVVDSTGCCVVDSAPFPQTWAWKRWVSERRGSAACASVSCPPLPAPPPPPECAFDVRCEQGRCKDACPQ